MRDAADFPAPRSPPSFWFAALVASVLAGVIFLAFAASPIRTSFDSRWVIFSADSYLQGKGGDLAAYPEVQEMHDYGVEPTADGRVRNVFPDGPSFLAIPFVAALKLIYPDFERRLDLPHAELWEAIIASFYCALAAACLFMAVQRYSGRRTLAIAATLVFAFGTSLWSTASRAMWQHGPVMLCYALAIWIAVEAIRRPWLLALLGAPLAIAVICRPTAVIPAAIASLAVLILRPRLFAFYLIAPALIASLWIAHNLAVHHAWLPPYYQPSRLTGDASFMEALAGNLVSPNRGLFVFTPVLLLALAGPFLPRVPRAERIAAAACLLVTLLHLIAISRFPHWWGGSSYGPRLMSDMVPVIAIPALLTVRALIDAAPPIRLAGLGLTAALAIAGIVFHSHGALSWGAYQWNGTPVNVDQSPQRVWDWGDLQMFRTRQPEPAVSPGSPSSTR